MNSVLAQTVQDLEIVVVDDASPEPATVEDDSRIRLIRAPRNGGPAAARNMGAEAARGQIIAFLDDDDSWTPDRLSLAAAAMESAPVAVCWQSADSGRILNGDVHDCILDDLTPNLGATAIMRQAWVRLDESYRACEDLVWWLAVSRKHEVATVPKQGLVVRRHAGPRVGYGIEARISGSLRVMAEHRQYFDTHPRAAAFRWKRIGLMNLALGRNREARVALRRCMALSPEPRGLYHYVRSYWVRGRGVSVSED